MNKLPFDIFGIDGLLNPDSEIRKEEKRRAHEQWIEHAGSSFALHLYGLTTAQVQELKEKERRALNPQVKQKQVESLVDMVKKELWKINNQ